MRRLAALLALSAGAYALVLRPRLLRWGATDDEVRGPFPGGDLVPGGRRRDTMAVTLDAPPAEVWPWLLQMGCDRAGWYSWDALDNAGVPSADRIHEEWQDLKVGDRMASHPSGNTWFEVAALEPPRFLGLRACVDLRTGRSFGPRAGSPKAFLEALWGFHLEERPPGRTRLVVSGYSTARPEWFQTVAEWLFWEPVHWVMQTRQFAGLQRRVRSGSPAVRG